MPKTKSKSKSLSKSKTLRLLERAHRKYEEMNRPEMNRPLNVVNESPNYDINRDLDNTFTKKFIENYERIKVALSKSGRHSINREKAQEFIDRQITPLRRQAAKDLIDNTHYISLKDIFNIVEELLLKTYAEIDITQPIYLYCGEHNKSFYFFACIALHFIKKHKLVMPHFVYDMTSNFLLKIKDCPLIILDDASYSGSQLSNMLNEMFYYVAIEEERPPPRIYALLASVNDQSLRRLSKVPTSKFKLSGEYNDFVESPFKIMYVEKYNYKSLVLILGIERYFYINLFFNAFLAENTNIALYLDHKVADMTSTYKNVYVYGPIVPPNYDLKQVDEAVMIQPIYLHYFFDSDVNRRLYENFLMENPMFEARQPTFNDSLYTSALKRMSSFLIDKALAIDIQDKPYSLNVNKNNVNKDHITLEFCPFINGCNKSTKLKEIIKNPLVLESQYLFFMFDLNVTTNVREYENILTHSVKKTKEVIKLLDSHRCPENWYKNGILQLV